MNITYKFSPYFSAVTLNPAFPSKSELESDIKEKPIRFSYGNASYSDYEKTYNPQGLGLRKIAAIPAAYWAGIVKTIYHLAKVIFYGIPLACCGDNRPIKADLFRIARDIQEAFGWIVTLFHDKRGSYLVQESLFQKECYSYFEKKIFPDDPWDDSSYSYSSINGVTEVTINGIRIPHYNQAEKITLRNLRDMNPQDRKATIEKFQLQSSIDGLGGEAFFHKLREANEGALGLNLVQLMIDVKAKKLKYALLSDQEFEKLTISQLEGISESQMRMILRRLETLKNVPSNALSQNLLEVPIAQFDRLPSHTINAAIRQIPDVAFSLFTDDQIKELDTSPVSEKQLKYLFRGNEEGRRRFALLSSDQVQNLLDKLDQYRLSYISDKQLEKLDLTPLSDLKLQHLFSYMNGSEVRRRFALLPKDQVQKNLTKFDGYRLRCISDKQLEELDLTPLSDRMFQELFSYMDDSEMRRRFALLPTDQVQKNLTKLDGYRLRCISDKHLEELDLTPLSDRMFQELFSYMDGEEARRRFALLSPEQLQKNLDKLDKYRFRYISDKQLKGLELTPLSDAKIHQLFSSAGSREEKRRLSLLPPERIPGVLDRLARMAG